ncbi:MAG: beta-N-acetylhexosaminidase [Planctomycetota bacterium]|nr:beta-N-acetylhexosaminidase [Planctomycetota bacterium]
MSGLSDGKAVVNMPLQLIPQAKELKILHGTFDFREVDTLLISKRASPGIRLFAEKFCEDLREICHSNYQMEPSGSVRSSYGCLLTSRSRRGVFVETQIGKMQGYELVVAGHCLSISAVDEAGFHYATRSIRQLVADGPRVPAVKIVDYPLIPFRGLHLDLTGLTPNFQTLKDAIERAALYKLNALLIEYGDRFAYECAPEVRGPGCLGRDQIKELSDLAAARSIELIPMVSTLGDLERFLGHPSCAEHREIRDMPHQICPSDEKANRLVWRMLREVMDVHTSKLVHVGGGRPPFFGRCERCSKAVREKGEIGLFMDYLARIGRILHEAGRVPMLWDDMLRDAAPDQLKRLPKGAVVVCRMFEGKGGQYRPEHLPMLDKYAKAGLTVYGCACVRGASAPHSNAPDYRERMDNVDFWADAAENTGALKGLVAAGPARHSPMSPICDPFPTIWPGALYAAERFWAGLSTSRESFERRLLTRFYGLRPDAVEVVSAHYRLAGEMDQASIEALEKAKRSAKRSRDILELLEYIGRLRVHEAKCGALVENASRLLHYLESGAADPLRARSLLAEVNSLREAGENMKRELGRILSRRFYKTEVDELIASRFLFFDRLADAATALLKKN